MNVLLDGAAVKNVGYVAAFFATTTYLGISPESILILTAVIVIDIITGVLKSATLHGWHSITSSKFSAGVLAKLLLILIPVTLALAGKGVGLDLALLTGGSISVLILSQVYSIIGNIHAMQTLDEKNEFDAVAFIMKQLRDILERSMTTDRPKDPPTTT
jgi:phage-related holin